MVPVSGYIKEESSNFEPVNLVSTNEVKDNTDDTLLTLSYKDSIYTIHQVNKIIYHNIFIGKTSLLPREEDGEVILSQVKACTAQFYQQKYMFLVSLIKGQATDIITYGAITKGLDMQLQYESELDDKGQLFLFRKI